MQSNIQKQLSVKILEIYEMRENSRTAPFFRKICVNLHGVTDLASENSRENGTICQ